MADIRFDHIAGEGKDALYNLYFDTKLVGSYLTLEEVLDLIAADEKCEKQVQ